MSEKQSTALDQLKDQLDAELISKLQNPIVLRIFILALIGIVGLGSLGTPFYFRIETLQELDRIESEKKILIEQKENVENALKVFRTRLSPNTRYIQWMSEIRELAINSGLSVLGMDPRPILTKNKNEIQKLIIVANFSGSYANLVQFIGIMENRKYGVHVDNIRITPEDNKVRAVMEMAMLLQPMAKSETVKKDEAAASSLAKPLASKFNLEPDAAPAAEAGKSSATPTAVSPSSAAQTKPETQKPPLPQEGPGGKFSIRSSEAAAQTRQEPPHTSPADGKQPTPPGSGQKLAAPAKSMPEGKFALPDKPGDTR